jgi:phosphatidylinositol glycan class B
MLTRKSKKYIAVGIIFHLLAIIFSIGFFRHDEQRELLQTVGYQLGFYDSSYLSYQFHAHLRPWLQPLLYVWSAKIYSIFFDLNPNHLAMLFRFISSLLGISSLWVLYKTFEERFQETKNDIKNQEYYFFFAATLWFLPFLHARTSNENLCSSFFIFGLYHLAKKTSLRDALITGILLGISFVLRFQMVVMISTSVLWFLVFRKYSIKNLLIIIFGFLLVVAISTVLDSHYYGQFAFTPYNYFNVNIIQKYVDQFGSSPWYEYFIQAFKDGVPPLSLFFIFTFLLLWIKFPKSLLTWITLPFFVVHSLIAHKEFRFIFPIVFFLPMIFTFLIMELNLVVKKSWVILFQVFNIPLLIYFSLIPASNLMNYYQHLYYKKDLVEKVYVTNPFEDYTKFYLKNDIKYTIYTPNEVKKLAASDKKVYFFAMNLQERDLILENAQCRIDFSLFPKWLYDLEILKKRRTFRSWTLVECSNQ